MNATKGPKLDQTVNWGIAGTGFIAGQFTEALQNLPDAEIAAVGSRTEASAKEFATRFGARRWHSSYEELARDPDVDIVYVATPNTYHAEHTQICLDAGKAVLCEKPFAMSLDEGRQLVNTAKKRNVFLMEALWTRFLPLSNRIRKLLAEGIIGDVRMVTADFGFRAEPNPGSRLFDPGLGGGSLLDVGVYCLSLASMVLGPPQRVCGFAAIGETMVDEQSGIVLEHGEGRIAVLSAAIRTRTPQEATIMGTRGYIKIHPEWWRPTSMTLSLSGEPEKVLKEGFEGNGFAHEALEVMSRIRAGDRESSLMPLEETLMIAQTMDELRSLWGLAHAES